MATNHKIIPVLTPLTPLEVYLQQVKGTYDAIRFTRRDMTYFPPQFGGLFGQQAVVADSAVLELTNFEVE